MVGGRISRRALLLGVALAPALMLAAVAVPESPAFAWIPAVSTPWPPTNPTDGQTVTVSGTQFPPPSGDPSGLQILECADPGGITANLPTSAAVECDASTASPTQISTDAKGDFSAQYIVALLSSSQSNIVCDQTHFCVLWVGVDFNEGFLTPHRFAFSAPFEVQSATAQTPEVPITIALPATAAVAGGGVVAVARRRRVRPHRVT